MGESPQNKIGSSLVCQANIPNNVILIRNEWEKSEHAIVCDLGGVSKNVIHDDFIEDTTAQMRKGQTSELPEGVGLLSRRSAWAQHCRSAPVGRRYRSSAFGGYKLLEIRMSHHK